MLPAALQPEHFSAWPPQARGIAIANIATLRYLPLSFLPSLLRALIDYDDNFPAERAAMDFELARLSGCTPQQLQSIFHEFTQIRSSADLEHSDWLNHPSQFLEQQSAYLWSTHQLDAFREAATRYGDDLRAAAPPRALPIPRLGIAVIGRGVQDSQETLFRKLRPHGVYFSRINPQNGLEHLLSAVELRAQQHAGAFAHWYVDGGQPLRSTSALTCVSYEALGLLRARLLGYIESQTRQPGMGPEELRTRLAQLQPANLAFSGDADRVLSRFQMKLFTEGSGTQIFSTTFAQWATREALRRAEPLTMLVRYAPRQRQRSMNEMLAPDGKPVELDLAGSLVDADFAAWYHWLNQQRLPGAEQTVFLAWFEGHGEAVLIAPGLPRGTSSSSSLDLKQVLALAAT